MTPDTFRKRLSSRPAADDQERGTYAERLDAVYRFILFTAVFFALLVLRLCQLAVRALPVSVAWWAYTFPSAALGSALIRYCQHVPGGGERLLAWAGLALTTIAVVGVGLI